MIFLYSLQYKCELCMGILEFWWRWLRQNLENSQRNHSAKLCRRPRCWCSITQCTKYHLSCSKRYFGRCETGTVTISSSFFKSHFGGLFFFYFITFCGERFFLPYDSFLPRFCHKNEIDQCFFSYSISQIAVVNIEMPNIHYYPFDMSKFPLVIQGENKEVYHPVDKPNGNIFSQLARVDIPIGIKSKL